MGTEEIPTSTHVVSKEDSLSSQILLALPLSRLNPAFEAFFWVPCNAESVGLRLLLNVACLLTGLSASHAIHGRKKNPVEVNALEALNRMPGTGVKLRVFFSLSLRHCLIAQLLFRLD